MLYAYLLGKPRSSAPKIEIPLHTIMKITWDGWNEATEERFYLGPEPIAIVPDKAPDVLVVEAPAPAEEPPAE